VLKNLSTKKIIKETKNEFTGKDKNLDQTNRKFLVEMIDDVLEFIKEAK